ncbi:MAG: lantibiotic dehydratase family protein, partial [Bacteroidetes bacterium]|nr:lantibiotic dehydratase family protein [Bacteroidota bacterium]
MQYLNKIVFRTPLFSITKEITQPYFNEALYLASSNLYDETQKQSIKNANKVNVSLYKYQTRSQNRCTPFGLFAGLSIGNWQNENNIILNADLKKALSRKTRLDMNVLYSLAQKLTKLDFIKPFLKYYPNTSIYQIGKHYRYVEYYYENNIRFHKINKIDYSEYIVGILCACKQGLTQQNISNLLVDEDISIEEANAFVEELILSQVLINQFEPKITGNDYFGVMLEELKKINSLRQNIELQKLISVLVYIEKLIQQLDENIFNEIESYKHIYETLKQVLPDISETNLFQTDLYKQYDNAILNHEIQTQIKNTISFLDKITLPNSSKNIETFIQNFYGRYEDDEVALSTVLDTESGIGYPSKDSNGINDLLNGFYFSNLESETNIKWNLLQNCLFKLLNDGLKENKKVIKISEENFKEVDFSKSILPLSFCVMFNVINAQTNKINIKSIGGSSAVNLLGRFACGDKEIEEIVMQITDFEQKQEPEKIFAEIVHLPESRTGNILFRPCIRKFEIPYLAKSSVEESFQIKMTDLFIRVRNNKIILFDKRLNKEIIPRLGNAHNFHFNSLPVYHFLCDLQTQYFEKSYLGFNWGVLSDQYSYLPRVEFQNVILSPAKWQLNKVDIEYLQVKKKGEENVVIYQRFFELKNRIELPDKFLVIEGDNELLIDTSVPIAIDTFIDIVKNKNQITLEEYLFDDNEALVKDSEGNSFTNECIAIVLNENKLQPVANNATKEKQSKKIFSIGSEWLYYKIYCGVKTADD